MGLFDFFKKIIEKKVEEPKITQEKITFSEIENWIERKINNLEINEKEIFFLIQGKIDIFTNELDVKIDILKSVNVKEKKSEEKINSIVDEGRKKYIESLRNLIDNLKELRKDKLDKFIKDINKIFLDFNKSSHNSYERATILIGKEMANLKDSLKVFSGGLIKLFDENKNIIDYFNRISIIKLNLKLIKDMGEDSRIINEKIIFLDEKINEKERDNEKILEEIEKIKKSEDHIKNLEIRKKVKLLEEELGKEIFGLKQFIDFKALASFFHVFEEQMNIVKSHRDDFQTSFRRDSGESIIGLLNESKLNNEILSEKIRQINNKKEEIVKNKQEIKKDETERLYFEITNLIPEISSLKNEKSIDEKRRVKIKTNKKESIDIVKDKISEMNVEVMI